MGTGAVPLDSVAGPGRPGGVSTLVERLRRVHQKMVDAALVGDGFDRMAELAAEEAERPVAIVVPALDVVVVWPGVAAYRIGSTPTFTTGEIASQIERTREDPLTSGAIYFSFKSLRNDMGGIQQKLLDEVYRRDAVIPEFTWIQARKPSGPKVVVSKDRNFVRAKWTERGTRRAFWFVVYAKDKDGWTFSVLPASERSIALSADRKIEKIIVTSVDRVGKESSRR